MSAPAQQPVAFAIRGPIAREDLPGLCERVCSVLAAAPDGFLVCHVACVPADAVTVDALARLALVARRRGCAIRLCNASPELRALVGFMGLGDVLKTS